MVGQMISYDTGYGEAFGVITEVHRPRGSQAWFLVRTVLPAHSLFGPLTKEEMVVPEAVTGIED